MVGVAIEGIRGPREPAARRRVFRYAPEVLNRERLAPRDYAVVGILVGVPFTIRSDDLVSDVLRREAGSYAQYPKR